MGDEGDIDSILQEVAYRHAALKDNYIAPARYFSINSTEDDEYWKHKK